VNGKLKETKRGIITISVTQRSSLILPRAAFEDKLKENELLRPDSPK